MTEFRLAQVESMNYRMSYHEVQGAVSVLIFGGWTCCLALPN